MGFGFRERIIPYSGQIVPKQALELTIMDCGGHWQMCHRSINGRFLDFGLWTLDFGLWALDSALSTQHSGLLALSSELRATSYRLRAPGKGPRAVDSGNWGLKIGE